ncbi:MAG: hypothetical protein Kow0029_18130 [Candidatus Rifleibacteriota bacterium]
MFLINNSNIFPGPESERFAQLKAELGKFGLFIRPEFLTSGEEKIERIVFRQGKRCLMLASVKRRGFYILNLLVDFSSLSEKHLAKISSIRNVNPDISFLFFPSRDKSLPVYGSGEFSANSRLSHRAINLVSNLPNKYEFFSLDDKILLCSPASPQRDYRVMLAASLPAKETERDLQLFLAILGIFSVFLWKSFLEFMLLQRIPDISIKISLFSLFLIVSLLPLVSSAYLSNEFLVANFKNERNKVVNQLNEELTKLDIKTLDSLRYTVNLFKSLNTKEKLQKFTGLKTEKDIYVLAKALLEKIRRDNQKILVTEVWTYDDRKKLDCITWNYQSNSFEKAKTVDQIIADIIRPRLDDYLKRFSAHDKSSSKKNELVADELKLEVIDELFLNLCGQKSYFGLKEKIDTLLTLQTTFDKIFLLSVPVFEGNRPVFILNYIMDSFSVRQHFPFKDLANKPEHFSFTLYGTGSYLQTRPFLIKTAEKKYPDMLEVAKFSHLSRYQVETQIVEASGSPIIIARPQEFSDYVVVSKKSTRNLESFAKNLKFQGLKVSIVFLFLLILVSTLISNYFLIPINRLIHAARQMINENFSFRLETDHPDEFSDISSAFNLMARKLEEGELLKTYVSSSIEKSLELPEENVSSKAERINATIVFSGIKGFKELRKKESPEEAFRILQKHLEAASVVCEKFGGEIDKMIEDKVMIVFEESAEFSENAAKRAVKAAENLDRIFRNEVPGMVLSIGINSGEVVSGIMGSESVRLSKTVVGDPVNLAARLASIAEEYIKDGIILSGETLRHLPISTTVEKLEINSVKGKTQTVEIFLKT